MVMDLTRLGMTVTWQVAVRSVPSFVVAVMIAVPTDKAVTRPSWSTWAIFGLLLSQVTLLSPASWGSTVAFRVSVDSISNSIVFLSSVIDDAFLGNTVMVHEAVTFSPETAVAMTVVLPADMPSTNPSALTVATSGSVLVHLTALLRASSGSTVAVSCRVESMSMEYSSKLSFTDVTGMSNTLR